eukprot:m.141555 g.141555  ORF g.141555 m.141555 type:complete len:593 (+) comp16129_c0_seq1:116-1894(+)
MANAMCLLQRAVMQRTILSSLSSAGCNVRCLATKAPKMAPKLQSPLERYQDEVEHLNIKLDPVQMSALEPLERLHHALRTYRAQSLRDRDSHVLHRCKMELKRRQERELAAFEKEQEELYGFAGEEKMKEIAVAPELDQQLLTTDLAAEAKELPPLQAPPKGVYLWGPVGCGKSMLMDIFHDTAPLPADQKLRIHFHSFVRDVLASLHRLNQHATTTQRQRYADNMVQLVAKNIASQATLLCFDEMQIPDVGSAAVLYRLFHHLHDYGVVMVATSNRAPDTLYQGHFKESLFDPFLDVIETQNEVLEMSTTTDYRRLMEKVSRSSDGNQTSFTDPYFFGPARVQSLRQAWNALTKEERVMPSSVYVFGRNVSIPESTQSGAAYFDFATLCSSPLGAADYLAIARQSHSVFLQGIPKLTMTTRNEARRFITLVDALYECKTKLYADFALPMERLFIDVEDHEADAMDIMHREMMTQIFHDLKEDDGQTNINKITLFTGEEEVFASKRCISRLQEMRSPMYMSGQHQPSLGAVRLDSSTLDYGRDNDDIADKDPNPASSHENRRKKPVFGSRHFFGAGWWEAVLAKKAKLSGAR